MAKLSNAVVHFFRNQHFVIVSTIDKEGHPHSSCKDVVKINSEGEVYLLDLYREKTFENLRRNPFISVTAVDEHHFRGYCLKGQAKAVEISKLHLNRLVRIWENRIIKRISHRMVKNIHGERGHLQHPEAKLPIPAYVILVCVNKVVDLTPAHLKVV